MQQSIYWWFSSVNVCIFETVCVVLSFCGAGIQHPVLVTHTLSRFNFVCPHQNQRTHSCDQQEENMELFQMRLVAF